MHVYRPGSSALTRRLRRRMRRGVAIGMVSLLVDLESRIVFYRSCWAEGVDDV